MRPVNRSDLDSLIELKPVLLLDRSLVTANFVDSIVRRCPSAITTKEGNKTLPLELWLQILEWARTDRMYHLYHLVQFQAVEEGPTRSLLCAIIPQWDDCGLIKRASQISDFEYYVDVPGEGPDDRRPFDLPDPLSGDPKFRIPITALDEDDKMLFNDLTVPDVIAWMEYGDCDLCGKGRIFCRGCRDGREVAEEFLSNPGRGDCGTRMLCPLCVGRDYAEESVWQYDSDNEGDEGYMTDGEYGDWVAERYNELGY